VYLIVIVATERTVRSVLVGFGHLFDPYMLNLSVSLQGMTEQLTDGPSAASRLVDKLVHGLPYNSTAVTM